MQRAKADVDKAARAYRYGLLPPLDWDESCNEEVRRGIEFWNALVDLDNARREAVNKLALENPEANEIECRLEVLEEKIETLKKAKKAANQSKRSRHSGTEIVAEIKAVSAEIKDLRRRRKEIRKSVFEANRNRLDAINAAHKAAAKRARQDCAKKGGFWPNYNAVASSFMTAAKSRKGAGVRYKGMSSNWRLCNQIQGGMSVDELLAGSHSQVSVKPIDPAAWDESLPRGQRDRLRRTTVTITVHTKDRIRKNVTFPMIMHRELPEGARIKDVQVNRELRADRAIWSIVFSVREPNIQIQRTDDRSCHIMLGPKATPQGLRVAVLADDRKNLLQLTLGESPTNLDKAPQDLLSRDNHADELASQRDVARNAIVSVVKEWAKQNPPPLLEPLLRAVAESRVVHGDVSREAGKRLVHLCKAWRDVPWQPKWRDELEDWRHDDLMLWRECAGLRKRITRQRTASYSEWAAQITKRYSRIFLPNTNFAVEMSEQRHESAPTNDTAALFRRYRRLSSVGHLRDIIKNAATRRGCTVEFVDASEIEQVVEAAARVLARGAAPNRVAERTRELEPA